MELHDLTDDERTELRSKPDWLLQYFSPMQCGEKERLELIRRKNEEFIARKS